MSSPERRPKLALGCLGTLGLSVIAWGIWEQMQGVPETISRITQEPNIATPISTEAIQAASIQWEGWKQSVEMYGALSVPAVALLALGIIVVLNLPRVRYKGTQTLLRLDAQTSIDLTTTDRRNISRGMKVERQLPHPQNGAWIPDFAADELSDLYRRVKH